MVSPSAERRAERILGDAAMERDSLKMVGHDLSSACPRKGLLGPTEPW